MVEYMQAQISPPDHMVVYFFCSHAHHLEQTPADHFRMSMAAQFVLSSDRCFKLAAQKYDEKRGFQLRASEYDALIDAFIRKTYRTFVIVDAIDELGAFGGNQKEEFMAILGRILGPPGQDPNSSDIRMGERKILITSRNDATIRESMYDRAVCLELQRCKNGLKADMRAFVSAEVDRHVTSERIYVRDKTLLRDVEDGIFNTATT